MNKHAHFKLLATIANKPTDLPECHQYNGQSYCGYPIMLNQLALAHLFPGTQDVDGGIIEAYASRLGKEQEIDIIPTTIAWARSCSLCRAQEGLIEVNGPAE